MYPILYSYLSLPFSKDQMRHYDYHKAAIYQHYAKVHENIVIEDLNSKNLVHSIESNLIDKDQALKSTPRPILIYHFNPYKNKLIVTKHDVENVSLVRISKEKYTSLEVDLKFWDIKMGKKDGTFYHVYVLDHGFD